MVIWSLLFFPRICIDTISEIGRGANNSICCNVYKHLISFIDPRQQKINNLNTKQKLDSMSKFLSFSNILF